MEIKQQQLQIEVKGNEQKKEEADTLNTYYENPVDISTRYEKLYLEMDEKLACNDDPIYDVIN